MRLLPNPIFDITADAGCPQAAGDKKDGEHDKAFPQRWRGITNPRSIKHHHDSLEERLPHDCHTEGADDVLLSKVIWIRKTLELMRHAD